MPSPARFSLSRASEADLPEIIKLCWLSFDPTVRLLMLGCPTEENLPKLVEHHRRVMRESQQAVWLKVVEGSTGRVVAASLWKVYPNAGQPPSGDEQPPSWLEGEVRESSRKLLDEINQARREANPTGFIRESPPCEDEGGSSSHMTGTHTPSLYRSAHLLYGSGVSPSGRRGADDEVGLRPCRYPVGSGLDRSFGGGEAFV